MNNFKKRNKKLIKAKQRTKSNPSTKVLHINNQKKMELLIQGAITKMLFDENDCIRGDAVKRLDELLGEIDNRQVNRSAITSNLKTALRWLLGIIMVVLLLLISKILWDAFSNSMWPSNVIVLLTAFSTLGVFTGCMFYGVKFLNKTDTYNMFILALTIISLSLSIVSLTR